MAAIAIIPARGGSKRIPRKNIVPFCGKPLLVHALEAARDSRLFAEIHVSTEDLEIADAARRHGFPPLFLRARELADDMTGVLPVCRWVLEEYERRGRRHEDVCLLYATAPLIGPADLAAGHGVLLRSGRRLPVLAAARFPCPAEWAMRLDAEGRLTPREPGMAGVRSQDLPTAWYDSGTFMWLSREMVLEGLPADTAFLACELPRWKAVDIDEADDLEMARRLFEGQRRP